mmetsp:Transcript_61690/g.69090  ORF Transcript_61690/g.69090 Transcript_61690/m.69090 type:complete len:121 (-) Transcript_61690:516-878(-)
MINDIDTDDHGMEQCPIIDSSNKIRRRRTGTTSEVDDYCYSRNYQHKHKHNRSFLRYYSSALEIINEEEHQQQQQRQLPFSSPPSSSPPQTGDCMDFEGRNYFFIDEPEIIAPTTTGVSW